MYAWIGFWLTVKGSFACAPRYEIALIGFISTGR